MRVLLTTLAMGALLVLPAQLTKTPLDKAPQTPTNKTLRKVPQDAFQVGEKLDYTIRYGVINAGEATVKVEKLVSKNDRPSYHMVGTGRSVGMAEWFFKTRDRYESFIDEQAMVPWEFVRDVNEGGHIIERHLIFNQYTQKVKDLKHPNKGIFTYAPYAQDMLSAFYYARAHNTKNMKVGESLSFTMFLDHEQFPFTLKLLDRKVIKTNFGKVNCLVLRPVLQKGRVFKDQESMTIYVTDDANKIPVLIQSELLVGSIKVELSDYEGLRNPVSFF